MTTVDGNHVAYGSGGYYSAQIVYTLTYPSDAQARIDWELRGYHNVSLYDSSNTSGWGGDLGAGSGARSYASSGAGYIVYASGTAYVTRAYGATVAIGESFSIAGLADGSGGGATSTATAAITVAARPYTVPSAPGQPTMSAIEATTATATWADPGDWGGNDSSDFDVQRATDAGFTTPTTTEVLDGNTLGFTGLVGNTNYWCKERAKNVAGPGVYGTARSWLTKPSLPTGLAASAITPVSVTLACTAPTGGATGYRLQVATDAGFTALVHDSTAVTLSRSVTGLTPATTYYYRWMATNATGNIGWTTGSTFATLAGMYVWDGATLKESQMYVWDGATLKPCDIYRFSAGAWRR